MKTKAIIDKARELCNFLDYHNKNLTKCQYELFLDLKEEVGKYDKRKKMRKINVRNVGDKKGGLK